MILSKHNITGPVKESDLYYIINPLSRQADLMDKKTAEKLYNENRDNTEELIKKGYLVDEKQEEAAYRKAYLDFLDKRDEEEIQLFYVPTYACNFACTYCYQEGYEPLNVPQGKEAVKAFFKYIDNQFAGRRKYVTIFGGEPLLPGENHKQIIETIIEEANVRDLGLAFVTNGYTLMEYLPLLKKGKIREVQITIDGIANIHDKRRPLKGGKGTFQTISEGVDAVIKAGMPVNLRAVMDKENMPFLPDLARYAKKQGWTDSGLFKTQLGRNYELHFCQADQDRLYDRVSMYEDVYALTVKHPEILEFHKPAFSLSRFLFEEGEMPEPLFDSCPGCKSEWAFDYTGRIYSCTATVGKEGETLGTFYPEVSLKTEIVEEWEERDVTTIPECKDCNLKLACGGGCASVAKNKTGKIQSPDCRPVDKLMSLGMGLYFNNQTQEN